MRTKDTAKLLAKFEILMPKSVWAARHWLAGQEFAFIPKGEGLSLLPVPTVDELAGMARGAKPGCFRERTDRV